MLFTFSLWCWYFRLEEQQRAEKRNREANGHKFTPRWFDLSGEITPTPWGDLEVYEYNGKYTEHRAVVDSSDVIEEVDINSIAFNPWQYGNVSAEWHICSFEASELGFRSASLVFAGVVSSDIHIIFTVEGL